MKNGAGRSLTTYLLNLFSKKCCASVPGSVLGSVIIVMN